MFTQVSGPELGSATHEGSYPCKLVEPFVSPYDMLCYVMTCLNTYDSSLVLTETRKNLIPYFSPQVIMNEENRTWTWSVVDI